MIQHMLVDTFDDIVQKQSVLGRTRERGDEIERTRCHRGWMLVGKRVHKVRRCRGLGTRVR